MAFSQKPYESEDAEKRHQLEVFIAEVLSLTRTHGSAGEGSASALPGDEASPKAPEPPLSDAEKEEILDRYVEHYRCKLSTYRPIISAVIDQPEFQPVSFLNLGLERSSAVCRIARYCSRKTLDEILGDMYNNAERRQNDFPNLDQSSAFNAAEELKITFRIPDSVFREIFPATDTLRDLLVCIKRLQQPENVSRLLQLNPLPIGTGFLVGGSHLMTNHHVIPSAEVARQCVAQFSYEDLPRSTSVAEYEFAPDLLFVSNAQLDYTLVQLKPDATTRRTAGYRFGWIDLVETTEGILPTLDGDQVEELIKRLRNYGYADSQLEVYGLTSKEEHLAGDRVAIIQHPRGRKKEIVLQDNGDVQLTRNNLIYRADTDYGSSGSPVFNQCWQLVALTKRVMLAPLSTAANFKSSKLRLRWIASVGTRIFRVIENLKKKSVNLPKLQSFIQDFVLTAEQLTCPPLPIALELTDGSQVNCGNSDHLNTPDAFTLEIWVKKQGGLRELINRKDQYQIVWGDDRIWIDLFDGERGIRVTTNPSAPPSENQWHHLAFTWERNSRICIYIDGELQNTKTDLSELRQEKEDGLLTLGGSKRKLGASVAIAEVRLWNIARSRDQIQSTYKCRLHNEPNLVGYWRFQEGEGRLIRNYVERLPDQSASSIAPPNSSTLTTLNLNESPFGLEFNKDSYVDCGDSSAFDLSDAITMECWLKCEDTGLIINKGGGWDENGYSLYWFHNALRIELQNRALTNGKTTYAIHHPNVLRDGDWHHVAVTWENKSKQIRVYFDAQEQFPDGTSDRDFSDPTFSGPIGTSMLPLNLGRTAKTSVSELSMTDPVPLFTGALAEVRLWKVARTPEQIREFYDRHLSEAEITEFEGSLVGYWQLTERRGDRATNLVNVDLPGVIHKPQWLREEQDFHAAKGAYAIVHNPTWRIGTFPILPLPSALVSTDGSCVECPAEDGLSTPGDFTVEAWVNHKFGDCLIVSRGKEGSENRFALSWNDSTIQVQLQDPTGTKRTIAKTAQPIPPDPLWHHVAFTWKPDKRELPSRGIAIFLDGRWQDCTVVEDHFEGNFKQLQSELVIGDPDRETSYHSIAIAEVRLWKCSRTQDELTANLSRRFIDTETDLAGCWRLDSGGDSVFSLVSGRLATVHRGKWFLPPLQP